MITRARAAAIEPKIHTSAQSGTTIVAYCIRCGTFDIDVGSTTVPDSHRNPNARRSDIGGRNVKPRDAE
ncbi:MAG TPA: hypothetical protein VHS31_18420 [Tepidisphaeraceae bacterium]|jgi:hypothetical protein|nr:hypothetical protein [Tepidisphaeraceae bacterium]